MDMFFCGVLVGVMFVIFVRLFLDWYFDFKRIYKQASEEVLYEMRNGILSDKEKESIERWHKEFKRIRDEESKKD